MCRWSSAMSMPVIHAAHGEGRAGWRDGRGGIGDAEGGRRLARLAGDGDGLAKTEGATDLRQGIEDF